MLKLCCVWKMIINFRRWPRNYIFWIHIFWQCDNADSKAYIFALMCSRIWLCFQHFLLLQSCSHKSPNYCYSREEFGQLASRGYRQLAGGDLIILLAGDTANWQGANLMYLVTGDLINWLGGDVVNWLAGATANRPGGEIVHRPSQDVGGRRPGATRIGRPEILVCG